MNDFRTMEVQYTLDEAAAATRAGLAYLGISLMFLAATGACFAADSLLAFPAVVGALLFARLAAGEWASARRDRKQAAWMLGEDA